MKKMLAALAFLAVLGMNLPAMADDAAAGADNGSAAASAPAEKPAKPKKAKKVRKAKKTKKAKKAKAPAAGTDTAPTDGAAK